MKLQEAKKDLSKEIHEALWDANDALENAIKLNKSSNYSPSTAGQVIEAIEKKLVFLKKNLGGYGGV